MLEDEIISLLTERGLTLAVAESCTGGLVGHRLTQVPGSSAAFLGGVIAYDNAVKQKLLGVPLDLLEREGAVSEATALAMATGVRRLLGASVSLAITGIAGPTGSAPDKPLGLAYVALSAHPDVTLCERHVWQGDRPANKDASATAALFLLHRYLRDTER